MSLTEQNKTEPTAKVAYATGGATGKGWLPGQSGNPKGSKGYAHLRDTLAKDVFSGLVADFRRHGQQAIVRLRQRDVAAYMRVVVSLIPKEVHVSASGPLDDLTDQELAALVYAAKKAAAKAAALPKPAESPDSTESTP